MAALHSPSPRLPTPSSSTSRRSTTAPAAPKLRDSCRACASSKLKCYKEKPTCSRCAKRGLICEYVVTKRGGRKHESQSNINDSNTITSSSPSASSAATATTKAIQPLPSLSSWFALDATISSADSLPSPGQVLASPGPTTSSASSTFFPGLSSPMDQSGPSAFTDLTTDLDDFAASPVSFSMPDMSDTDFLGSRFFSTGVDNGSNGPASLFDTFPGSEDAVSELFGLSKPRSPPNSHASSTSDAHSYQGSHPTESPCFCLIRALGLMKQLFPSPSTACTNSATPGLDKSTILPTIQAVIAKNEHTIEAVSTMLQCSCSEDGYLLAIMSLIIFKVLGWYAAAARQTPSVGNGNDRVQSPRLFSSGYLSHSEQVILGSPVVGSYRLDGEDLTRMAAQLVLSELHRVQRLVNQLSTKLKMQAAKNGGMVNTPISSASENAENAENAESETTSSLSAVMLDQLEVDLRKRLRALSLEIVEGLRRE